MSALLDTSSETCGCWRCWVMMSEAAATRRCRARGASGATAARGAALFIFFLSGGLFCLAKYQEALLFCDPNTKGVRKAKPAWGNFCLATFGDWRFFSFPSQGCRLSPPRRGVGPLETPAFVWENPFFRKGRNFTRPGALENPRRSELDLEKFERTELPSFPSFAGRVEGRHSKARAY